MYQDNWTLNGLQVFITFSELLPTTKQEELNSLYLLNISRFIFDLNITYMDEEEKKNMAVTQFEAVDARRCFPCWDDPALKATFKITIDVPLELTALSNMPIINEKLMRMSRLFISRSLLSYQLIWLLLLLGYLTILKTQQLMGSRYFSMPYPLPKLDMVVVPEFSGGAMENYGLIIYREIDLLHDDLQSTAARKQRISYMATDSLFPEWKIWTQFLQQTKGGLCIDALEGSHPIEVEIHYARSVGEIFDAISYKKGSAVIRMLQGYLGDEIIQKALSSYMKKYAWKNVKTEDLWSVLSAESGVQVNSMMDSWTKQKGYPVISVKSEDHFLEFEQSQFLPSGLHGDGKWVVPITLVFGSYNRRKNFLLESKVERVDVSELFSTSEEVWVKVNIEQSGFYRVKYEDKFAAELRKAVEDNCLLATDKFGVLDDTYALCQACEISISSLLSLIDVCYSVLEILIDALPDSVNELKTFLINPLLFSSEKLGWESVQGEIHLNALLRGEVYTALATFGHNKTHSEAMQRFQSLLNDRTTPLLSADTKKAAYIAIMRNASTAKRSGFESLLRILREADAVHEKELVLECIASCPDLEIVLEVLNLLVSDEVRDQDIIYGLDGISLEGREIAWKWLKENWDQILNKYGDGLLITHFIRDIISPFCSNEKADEVDDFFATRATPGIAMNLKQSVEQVRIKARWFQSIKQESSLK